MESPDRYAQLVKMRMLGRCPTPHTGVTVIAPRALPPPEGKVIVMVARGVPV